MTLIAPFAQMARSTNRSTPFAAITGYQLQNVTAAGRRMPRRFGKGRPSKPATLLIAEPLDPYYKHEIIRRVNQKRDQPSAVRAEVK